MSVLNDVNVIPEISLYDPLRELAEKKRLKPGGGKPAARR